MKKIKQMVIILTAIAAATLFTAAATTAEQTTIFAGGSGTAEDPWQIETPQQLLSINDDLTASYILTADIDLSEYENWPMIGMYVMDEDSEEGEDPVSELAFTGSFNGNGNTISNMTIDASEDSAHMFGVGLFACVASGGEVKNVVVQDINVTGMMLVGGVVGYAFECTVDDVDVTAADPAAGRNTISSSMVMAGGVVGGLTCSRFTNCDIQYTDIIAAPGGNSGALGGGLSKPVLENCTVRNCTVTAVLDEVPMFGMSEGMWIGGLSGCINLGDYDTSEWYVKDCSVSDTVITVSGNGSHVGGLIGSGGSELADRNAPRMSITGCTVENVQINISDKIPCIGGLIGGGLSEGEPPHSFLVDGCHILNTVITTDADDPEESLTGLMIGQSRNCQFVSTDGTILDIQDRTISIDEINSTIDMTVLHTDGSEVEGMALVGQVITK